MRKVFLIIGLLSAMGIQLSCDGSLTREINVDYSDYKAKGVIFSILTNTDERDTAFPHGNYFVSHESEAFNNRIYISFSVPPAFGRNRFIKSLVTLESEGEEIPIHFIEKGYHQEINNPFHYVEDKILPGKTYHINAEMDPDSQLPPGYEWSPVSAMDTMPDVVSFSVENPQFEFSDGNLAGTPKGGYFDLKIEDEPGRTNVYLVEVSAIIQQDTIYNRFPTVLYGYIERSDKTSDLDLFENSRDDLFHEDDFPIDGPKRIRFRFSSSYGSYDREKPALILVRISNLSDKYIRFQRSSQQYSINKDNPFVEPVEIYTNVENGYGIFALAARSYGELEVK